MSTFRRLPESNRIGGGGQETPIFLGSSLYVSWSVFGSVVAVAFQIAFCAEIHANDVFFIFLKSFLISHIKTIQKV